MILGLSIPPLLELVSVSRLARFFTLKTPPATVDDAELARSVDRLLNHLPWPWRRTCLRRSAVLYALLREAGRPVQLWIGVRRDAGAADVTAHAWLTLGGAPYLEANPEHPGRHTPIARFPEPLTR